MDINKSSHLVGELYKDLTYYDLYGGSLLGFFILLLILFLVFAYCYVMKNMQPIKDDWVAQRCNPKVIPFAGLINKPDGVSAFDFTQQNFTYCMQNILTSITGEALQPLTVVTGTLGTLFDDIREGLNYIRTIVANVRTNMASMAQEVLGRIMNIISPLQVILIAFMDSMEKIRGILTAGLYTSLGTYYALQALLGAIVQFIVLILIILAALIIGLWIIPFTWPAAITGTAIFLATSIPLLIIMIFMNQVLHVDITSPIPAVPQRPHLCFDEDTQLEMEDGTFTPIAEIKVGDILRDGIRVTATLKVTSENAEMFSLGDDVVVSGTHLVEFEGKWIPVSQHPERKSIPTYKKPYLYSLNTTTKRIPIGEFLFADWDDVIVEELPKNTITGGYIETTPIVLQKCDLREIKDIAVGDILEHGEKVIGVVQMDTEDLDTNYIHIQNNLKNPASQLYHLLTECKYFHVDGKKVHDYYVEGEHMSG
jgi:hypothetical protein